MIEFDAWYGDEKKMVIISSPNGTSGESWNVLIDKRCAATIHYTKGQYVYYYEKTNFELEDLQAIVDRITDFKGEGYHQIWMRKDPTEKEYWARYGRKI